MRRNRGPYEPRHVLSPQDVAPFIAELGTGLAPGAGLADATGMYYSPMQGGTVPGLLENVRGGQYGTAAFQGLGMLGDAMWLGGPVAGAVVGGALKAPGAIAKGAKAANKNELPSMRVFHGSPKGEIEGLPRLAPHDETGIMGFSVTPERSLAENYSIDRLGRHQDYIYQHGMRPSVSEFQLTGRVEHYDDLIRSMQKKYQLSDTEYPTPEQFSNYVKKNKIVAIDYSRNLGHSEISVIDPTALQRHLPD